MLILTSKDHQKKVLQYLSTFQKTNLTASLLLKELCTSNNSAALWFRYTHLSSRSIVELSQLTGRIVDNLTMSRGCLAIHTLDHPTFLYTISEAGIIDENPTQPYPDSHLASNLTIEPSSSFLVSFFSTSETENIVALPFEVRKFTTIYEDGTYFIAANIEQVYSARPSQDVAWNHYPFTGINTSEEALPALFIYKKSFLIAYLPITGQASVWRIESHVEIGSFQCGVGSKIVKNEDHLASIDTTSIIFWDVEQCKADPKMKEMNIKDLHAFPPKVEGELTDDSITATSLTYPILSFAISSVRGETYFNHLIIINCESGKKIGSFELPFVVLSLVSTPNRIQGCGSRAGTLATTHFFAFKFA